MVRVLGDRVLVALPPAEDETVSPGGIVLVRDPDAKKTPTRGLVVQVGEKSGTVDVEKAIAALRVYFEAEKFEDGCIDCQADDLCIDTAAVLHSLSPAPFDVQVGDCVIFPPSAGEEFHQDGVDYVVLRESEIIGVVEPKNLSAESLTQAHMQLAAAGIETGR